MFKLGYYLYKATTWLFHIFPLSALYRFSDFIFFIIYHVIGYRRKVVETNLDNAFPDKSEIEKKEIEKGFYHHLCDIFIEILYYDRISEEEINKRVKYVNVDFSEKYFKEGRSVIVSMGHFNNWEWLGGWALHTNVNYYAVYKKLNDKSTEHFFRQMRARLGAIPLEKSDTYRRLITDSQNKIPFIAGFINDQTPVGNEIQYWTKFLNQDTPVLLGTEKLAKKTNSVVVAINMRKIKRGYYEVEPTLLTDTPKETEQYEITEAHTRFLEKIIMEKPEYWLWSHRRWKHKKVDNDQ
jgi:KDO2-lipid IV(A) lauroyltransferase